jgi:hypothetical protein
MLVDDGLADSFVVEEVGSAWHTTRQEQQVGIREVALLEHDISLDVDTMSRLYQGEIGDAYCGYVNTSTTQYVDGNQRFDILEAVC